MIKFACVECAFVSWFAKKVLRKWSTTRLILRRPPLPAPTRLPSLLSVMSARSLVRSPYAILAFPNAPLYFSSH
jgi:hypothetical protein